MIACVRDALVGPESAAVPALSAGLTPASLRVKIGVRARTISAGSELWTRCTSNLRVCQSRRLPGNRTCPAYWSFDLIAPGATIPPA